jgi:hypothetical protein
MLKIILSTAFILAIFSLNVSSQNINNLINNVTHSVKKESLSKEEIVKGLKEALNVGASNSVNTASKINGFYKNNAIKILFPPDLRNVESKLRAIGMGTQCDKFIEALNRGAEDAAKSAVPILSNAIAKLTINDGLNILKGNDNEATQYLKNNSSSALESAFLPIVKNSLTKVQITALWNPLAKAYNKIPLVKKINPDLNTYVAKKTVEGLFTLISIEELKIRKDPVARVSDILKKVFGAK